jgi:hypothetical protein
MGFLSANKQFTQLLWSSVFGANVAVLLYSILNTINVSVSIASTDINMFLVTGVVTCSLMWFSLRFLHFNAYDCDSCEIGFQGYVPEHFTSVDQSNPIVQDLMKNNSITDGCTSLTTQPPNGKKICLQCADICHMTNVETISQLDITDVVDRDCLRKEKIEEKTEEEIRSDKAAVSRMESVQEKIKKIKHESPVTMNIPDSIEEILVNNKFYSNDIERDDAASKAQKGYSSDGTVSTEVSTKEKAANAYELFMAKSASKAAERRQFAKEDILILDSALRSVGLTNSSVNNNIPLEGTKIGENVGTVLTRKSKLGYSEE